MVLGPFQYKKTNELKEEKVWTKEDLAGAH